ncbi:hypothetical protein [Streptomyces sp. NBC_00207]|uniref:hypothetical protein n=1 Tax=Streptomyces sp. NBC_00207 TaxID=2903635 RepID=UPI0032542840
MMPKKAPGGSTTAELLDYLFGPGEHDEHTAPHLVAAWNPDPPCPARAPDRITRADLALLLDAPVEARRGVRPAEHVWHVSVRNHPDNPVLFDDRWAQVAAAMVHAAGIAEHADEQACRWIAVRHATDHIHILATLARQDGRHPRLVGGPVARPSRRRRPGRADAGCGLAADGPGLGRGRRWQAFAWPFFPGRRLGRGHPRADREVNAVGFPVLEASPPTPSKEDPSRGH